MASEAARELLEYFRGRENGPGTTGQTGTAANKLSISVAYSGPVSPGLVPGRIREREPATSENGNKKSKENQYFGRQVPVVPAVPAAKFGSSNAARRHSLDRERAAIVEYDAGVPRAWAEGLARLLNMRAPPAVTAERWRLFMDDCGRFLDRWATQAASLGWGATDLFGMSIACPLSRLDLAGLVWLLEGRDIVALSAETATIRTASGTAPTFRRVKAQPGQRIAWEEDD